MTPISFPWPEVTPYAAAGVLLALVSLALRDIRLSCPLRDWGPSVAEEFPALTADEAPELSTDSVCVIAIVAVLVSLRFAVHS